MISFPTSCIKVCINHAKIIRDELCKKFNTDAVIAGGALRDSVTGKPVKDIDIIIHGDEKTDYFGYLSKLEGIKTVVNKSTENSSYNSYSGYGSGDIIVVFGLTFEDPDLLPIDIIVHGSSVGERIRTFPCNAAMIWLNRRGTSINARDEFELFSTQKELHLYPTANQKYKDKILLKYPECNLTVDLGKYY